MLVIKRKDGQGFLIEDKNGREAFIKVNTNNHLSLEVDADEEYSVRYEINNNKVVLETIYNSIIEIKADHSENSLNQIKVMIKAGKDILILRDELVMEAL